MIFLGIFHYFGPHGRSSFFFCTITPLISRCLPSNKVRILRAINGHWKAWLNAHLPYLMDYKYKKEVWLPVQYSKTIHKLLKEEKNSHYIFSCSFYSFSILALKFVILTLHLKCAIRFSLITITSTGEWEWDLD